MGHNSESESEYEHGSQTALAMAASELDGKTNRPPLVLSCLGIGVYVKDYSTGAASAWRSEPYVDKRSGGAVHAAGPF